MRYAPSFVAVFIAVFETQAVAQVDQATMRGWGLEVYAEIDATLRVPNTRLYAETAALNGTRSGGVNGRAFVWPASTQFRVLNTLTQIEPETYAPLLRQFSDQLRAAYWNAGYRSGAGAGDRFYDDNAHLVVALAEAYEITGEQVYLDRAIETHAFVLQGEDSVAGGGIYFKQNQFESKNTISTIQEARGAAMIYQATGQQQYLDDAVRLMNWTNSHVQQPNGLYYQGFVIATNAPGGVNIVNAAGDGIAANLELYEATDDAAYLAEAQRVASASLTRYFDAATGRLNDEGYWAFELVDALNDLYRADGNPLWLSKVVTAMEWLHENKRDPNGHYGLFWGRNGPQVGALNSWNLNEQAAVARAYLYTSTFMDQSSSVAGDVNQDGILTDADFEEFIHGWLKDTTAFSDFDKLKAGDLNLDGRTNLADFVLLRQAFKDAGLAFLPIALPDHSHVPEPESLTAGILAYLLLLIGCRR